MLRFFLFFFLLGLSSFSVSSQISLKEHVVKKGETVTEIAIRYKVTAHDIFQLNPSSRDGIKEGQIIRIPPNDVKESAVISSTAISIHEVQPKETLYGIAKLYGCSVEAIKKVNPLLDEGLKSGQKIKIPVSKISKTNQAAKPDIEGLKSVKLVTVKHIVQPKETKFSLAKLYGLTIADLESQNPGIADNLQVGMEVVLQVDKATAEAIRLNSKNSEKTTNAAAAEPKQMPAVRPGFSTYEVKSGDTLYSLTQAFGLTENELIQNNPALSSGLKMGMQLLIPAPTTTIKPKAISRDLEKTDISRSAVKSKRKELVLLLPFNTGKVGNDSINSLSERIKKDVFLNITLDFYAGALMAIDSARSLGLNFDVRIYDSNESKNYSNVTSLYTTKNLKQADAIIGPFYKEHAEALAGMAQADNVPVISPISKEIVPIYPNLYAATPSEETAKNVMFDYMRSKGGNIIIANDPKRKANRSFITENYADARFIELNETGALQSDSFKMLLEKDKINFVVLDSERTGTILAVTNWMLSEASNYDLQLVLIEPNETLDFNEISLKRLKALKMIYPSTVRDNSGPRFLNFEKSFRRLNNIIPNQYAIRGFDVTLDTMLRLAQDKSFHESATEQVTEHLESKFQYVQTNQGYMNAGVYILELGDGLILKQVN